MKKIYIDKDKKEKCFIKMKLFIESD